MIFFLKLLAAHFIGDFVLQSKNMVRAKEQGKGKAPSFYLHLLIHGGLVALFVPGKPLWLIVLLVVLSHGIIDLVKLYFQQAQKRSRWFLVDQGLHVSSLAGIALLWNPELLNHWRLFNSSTFWVYTVALLLLTVVSGIVLKVLLAKWTEDLAENKDHSLQHAGKWIGILERLFVFTFILCNQWSAIGFLIAAKSIFRFGDLKESKERKLTEYMLIGTLLSFAFAVATALLTLYALKGTAFAG